MKLVGRGKSGHFLFVCLFLALLGMNEGSRELYCDVMISREESGLEFPAFFVCDEWVGG